MLLLFVICCLLIAPLYVLYKPPAALIRYFQRRWPDVLWQVPTSKKLIALTIDDGPSEYTDEILEVLQADNATATFFIIGSHVSGREKTLKDLVLANTELDNHAMHDEPARSLRDVDLVAQIEADGRMIRSLYEAAGIAPPLNYFRPGSGFFSTRMRKIVAELGNQLVLGSIYPHDAQIQLEDVNARHIISMLRPGGIIVCHERSWTAPMLRKVLPELTNRGYRAVSVTELLNERSI